MKKQVDHRFIRISVMLSFWMLVLPYGVHANDFDKLTGEYYRNQEKEARRQTLAVEQQRQQIEAKLAETRTQVRAVNDKMAQVHEQNRRIRAGLMSGVETQLKTLKEAKSLIDQDLAQIAEVRTVVGQLQQHLGTTSATLKSLLLEAQTMKTLGVLLRQEQKTAAKWIERMRQLQERSAGSPLFSTVVDANRKYEELVSEVQRITTRFEQSVSEQEQVDAIHFLAGLDNYLARRIEVLKSLRNSQSIVLNQYQELTPKLSMEIRQ